MLGVLANTFTVLIGGAVGLLLRKIIPEKISGAVMTGIGLCVIYLGVSGALNGENALITILSIVIGTIIGTLLDLDGKLKSFSKKLEDRLNKNSGKGGGQPIAKGFMAGSLLFCVGSMTIVGSLQAGLNGDNSMLYTKSILDLVSAAMLASALGVGVLLSAGFVLGFQGAIVLLAGLVAPLLSAHAINEMTCAGSILIIGLGLNLLEVTDIKVTNYLPAIIIAPLLSLFM